MGPKQSKASTGNPTEDAPLTINHAKFKNIRVVSPPSEE